MKRITSAFIAFVLAVGSSNCFAAEKPTISGKKGNYNYVDLGLPSGTKWATCNLGAKKPEEGGIYLAWGESAPKDKYSWKNYKFNIGEYAGKEKFSKYSEYRRIFNEGDSIMVLQPVDDAATQMWGSNWRMPTRKEWEELVEGCNWKVVKAEDGSNKEYKVGISKKNGNVIYLTMEGYYSDDSFFKDEGHYWTSEMYSFNNRSREACSARVIANGIKCHGTNRKQGFSVRAVVK